MLFQHVVVRLHAETGAVRHGDVSVVIQRQRLLEQLATERINGFAVELKEETVGNGCNQMDVHFLCSVGCNAEILSGRQGSDIHKLGNTAQYLRIGIQDGGRFVFDQIAETVAGVLVLTGCNGDNGRARNLSMAAVVIRRDRRC